MKTTKSTHILLIIIVAGFLSISAAFETSAFEKITMEAAVKKDTLPTDIDRHPLISVGGGFFEKRSGFAMLGLEYPLDRNRDWNIEIAYYRLFYRSRETQDGGFLFFRRYLLSQDNVIRPSFHIGLPFHIGVALDATVIQRLLYAQVCLSVPIPITLVHQNSSGMPAIVTLNARIML